MTTAQPRVWTLPADFFREETEVQFARINDGRGCIHIFEDGRDPIAHTPGDEIDDNTTCMTPPDYDWAIQDLRGMISEAADRIDALTAAVEQLHNTAHPGISLALCPAAPCAGLHRYLPNARGVVVP